MILIDHSTFSGNFGEELTIQGSNSPGGGALCINGNVVEISINITSSTFENNSISTQTGTAPFGVGGAIFINSADQGLGFEIANSAFTNNSAAKDGGAIFVDINVPLTNFDVTDILEHNGNTFEDNTPDDIQI